MHFFYFFSYFEEQLAPQQRQQQPVAMVSRRKILSRSRDDLNLDCDSFRPGENKEEEDVWYAKEKLYKVSKRQRKSFSAALKNESFRGYIGSKACSTKVTARPILPHIE